MNHIDGTRVSSKEVSRVTLSEPVNEVIQDSTKGADHRKRQLRRQGHYNRRQICLAGNRRNVRFFGLRRSKTSRRYRYSKAGRRKYRSYNSSGSFGNRNHGNISSELKVCIVINHGNGLSTLYAHTLPGLFVCRSKVSAGQPIANIGSSGNVTGPHRNLRSM